MIRALISTGDPAGIGPEVSIKAVSELIEQDFEFIPVLVGDKSVIFKIIECLKIEKQILPWRFQADPGKIFFVDTGIIRTRKFPEGRDDELTGKASFKYFEKAWDMLQKDLGDCIITAPISKKSWNMAGISYSGHTEALSSFSKEKTYMLMAAGKLRVLLATMHIPIKKIWKYLTVESLFLSTRTTAEFITRSFRIKNVRIAFCGFNPHAGESGILGTEEKTIIEPVIVRLNKQGFHASGPYPSDSLFRDVLKDDSYDLIVSMYHDQALPVLKTLFFKKLVNITVNSSGWIRTSPGHGTAFDIAWKNKADASSMKQAIKTAVELTKRKRWTRF